MKKDEDVPEEVTSAKKNLTLKDLSEIFRDIESTKDKILEAEPNLEKSMGICQGVEKMLTPAHELYYEKKASSVDTTSNKCFMRQ